MTELQIAPTDERHAEREEQFAALLEKRARTEAQCGGPPEFVRKTFADARDARRRAAWYRNGGPAKRARRWLRRDARALTGAHRMPGRARTHARPRAAHSSPRKANGPPDDPEPEPPPAAAQPAPFGLRGQVDR